MLIEYVKLMLITLQTNSKKNLTETYTTSHIQETIHVKQKLQFSLYQKLTLI